MAKEAYHLPSNWADAVHEKSRKRERRNCFEECIAECFVMALANEQLIKNTAILGGIKMIGNPSLALFKITW